MNTLKLICLTLLQLPRVIVNAFKERRQQQPTAKEVEAERIDRLRNPSKYRGK